MHVGFLGLGAIGAPMAAHLARRGPLTVWNRTAERARAFAERHGATVAATPRAAAAAAEVVITCLGTSADVASLLEGPDGLLAGLRPGALLLDCTSGDPPTSRRIAERLAASGVAFADAPVSGGTNGAEAGTLTVMVGADSATFERARPVLAAFGKRIDHVGPVGAGDALKAVNNALLALNILAVGEGMAALVKAGVAAAARARGDQRLERPVVRERHARPRAGPHRDVAAHVPAGAAGQGRRDRHRPAGRDRRRRAAASSAARRCCMPRGSRWARPRTISTPSA